MRYEAASRRIFQRFGREDWNCSGGVWSVNYYTGKLLELGAVTGRILARLAVGTRPREVIVAAGDLWISDQATGKLVRVRR